MTLSVAAALAFVAQGALVEEALFVAAHGVERAARSLGQVRSVALVGALRVPAGRVEQLPAR